MKKVLLSVCFFIFILTATLYLHFFLIKTGDNIINQCNQMEEELSNIADKDENSIKDDPTWSNVTEQSKILTDYITQKYLVLSFYINHERLDYLLTELSRLNKYTKNKDLNESLSTINFIKSYTAIILREEDFSLRNILW